MKKMIFAAAMALCLMAGNAFAQDSKPAAPKMKERPTVEQMAQRQTERMTQQLKLTDAQAKQVYEINLAQIKQQQAQMEQMRAARKAEAEKMKAILSTEQFVQWSQMQGPRFGHGPQKMQGKEGKGGKDCKDAADCKNCKKSSKSEQKKGK